MLFDKSGLPTFKEMFFERVVCLHLENMFLDKSGLPTSIEHASGQEWFASFRKYASGQDLPT